MGLAGAASAAGVAAARPGAAAFGGPGGLALKPRADTAAKHPLPASSLLRRHKQLERLLEEKQQPGKSSMERAQAMGFINSTPMEPWEQRFREALYARPRRRAARR